MQRIQIGVYAALSLLALLTLGQTAQAQQFDSGRAEPPEFVGKEWLNTPDNKPITLESRKGKVTIVEFWTFG